MAEDVDTFRKLFDESPHPMWMFDRATRQFVAVNDAAIALFGWSRDELLAMRLDDVRPPEERAAMAAGFAAPRETLAYGRRGKFWTKRGDVMDVNVELRCIQHAGREVGVAMATNLTAVAEVERRFRLLVEHSGEAIALTNEHNVVEYLSPGGERILGCPASAMSAQSRRSASTRMTPASGSRRRRSRRRSSRSASATPMARGAGSSLDDEPDARSRGRRYVANYRDITERRKRSRRTR